MYINIHLSRMNLLGRPIENLIVPGLQLARSLWEEVMEAGCPSCLPALSATEQDRRALKGGP